MIRHIVAAAAAVSLWGAAAVAAPAMPAPSLRADVAAGALVEKVHGCHRYARDSLEGWHRHAGPYCDWVPARRSQRNPYAPCRTVCRYVGPIKTCRNVCYW